CQPQLVIFPERSLAQIAGSGPARRGRRGPVPSGRIGGGVGPSGGRVPRVPRPAFPPQCGGKAWLGAVCLCQMKRLSWPALVWRSGNSPVPVAGWERISGSSATLDLDDSSVLFGFDVRSGPDPNRCQLQIQHAGPRSALLADIFREIEEDLRAERMQQLWKRYGSWVIALAALIVIGAGVFSWWRDHQTKVRAAEGERYAAALQLADQGDAASAAAAM